MRPARGRALSFLLGAVAALGLGAAGWAAFAPLPQGSRELLYVIPKGTAARQAAGEAFAVLPSRIRLTIGVQDVLVLRNDDAAAQSVGPARLEPGQTYRLPVRAPVEFALACSAHREGQVAIVARAAPAPGWARLRWRLEGSLGPVVDTLMVRLPMFQARLWAGAVSVPAGGRAIEVAPGMPPVVDPANLYSEAGADKLSDAVAGALPRVYVPNVKSNDVYVIDPATLEVVDRFRVGVNPQHVVPSYDLKTLWVTNNAEGRTDGSLTPIDPLTGKPGKAIAVDDPYNMYFSPDGRSAIVVAEALKRLDFRDPRTMALQSSLAVPGCAGINHADFSIDGRFAIFTCEFQGSLAKIDMVDRRVLGYLKLSRGGMPQDIRVSPDGTVFFVADMMAGGVFLVDGARFAEVGFIGTGVGTHGLYPSRDGTKLYAANRGSAHIGGPPRGNGSVSVIAFATRLVLATWPIPGGGSPDMGNVSADGKTLWLSGRYDNVVYAIDTVTGQVWSIPVGKEPHGLTVWPQPGRYSLGHTGNMR